MLTSSEAIAIMKAKEKKQEDIIAKDNRKKETEQKSLKEAEARRKAKRT